ncbi:MAG: aldose 1-epimerase family protein [Ferruginibacter sp.]
MYTIENDILRVMINPVGAELTSLVNKTNGLEYLWSGDPAYWAKKSPVLFPVVGTLKNNTYNFNNKNYELGRHGFAREKLFTVMGEEPTALTFELSNDETTVRLFPFQFSLSINYTIRESSLDVTYRVHNKGNKNMYFSIGAHPAFKLPIDNGLVYEDYFLLFNQIENAGNWPIDANGLIESGSRPLLRHTDRLPLSKSLFYKDALVFKDLVSDEVQVKSEKSTAGLNFTFKGFPYFGIWSAKDAGFICLEPWCGIADSTDTNQQLTDKEGIIGLAAGEAFTRTWSVTPW